MIFLISSSAFAYRGGLAKYKYTKPYITKKGQYRSGSMRDVSGNGNKFDNANSLGLNGK